MKFSIERNSLLKSLNHVQAIVERRSTIPILSNVRLRASDNALELTATDMDISLIAHEAAMVEKDGETTVNAHMLFDIVRKLPDGSQVTMQQVSDGGELLLMAARSEFNLPCLASEEFPAVENAEFDVHFTMPSKDLAEMIDKTRFAISTEETRYYLNGIYLHVFEQGAASMLRAVATDGHRLARDEVALPGGADKMPAIIVPRKTVTEMRKLIGEQAMDVAVSVSTRRIQIVMDRAVLSSRLIDGQFPDYERVVPKENNLIASLNTAELTMAVDRVATVSMDKARAVKLTFSAGKVALSAISSDTARAFEEMECEYEGGTMEIGFNARYLLDMLECIDGDQVSLKFSDASSPTVGGDPDNAATLFVLMPMRV